MVFNNGARRPGGEYSTVDEIVPPVDSSGNYYLTPGTAYEPEAQVWMYTADPPGGFFAMNISGAQRLPDGNTLITNGPQGVFFEVTPAGEVVWEYDNPFPNPSQSRTFKAHRYAPDYPGLELLVNDPPEKPSTPDGPASGGTGVEYQYATSTTDPEGDQVYYLFDWADGTDSSWLGPYTSGATAEASHVWTGEGDYDIKVVAKDEHGILSEWSDSLPVSIGVLCGDANEDGVINVGDVVYLVTYLYKDGPSPQPTDCAGDVNGDDVVNVGDVVYLATYLYKGGPAPDPNCCNPPWKYKR